MKSTDPIAWNEGMILTPQHLQQNDLRFEQLLRMAMNLRCTHPWGIKQLQFDETVLANGEFFLLRTSGIFPSGFVFNYDAKIDEPVRVPFPEVKDNTLIHVYLALRKPLVDGLLVSGQEGRLTFGQEEDVPDVLTGEKAETGGGVGRLRPLLSLHFSQKQADRYELLQIARIRFRGNTHLVEPYSPPTYTIDQNHTIHRYCTGLVNIIREKIATLSDTLLIAGVGQDQRAEMQRRVFDAVLRELPPFEIRLGLPQIYPEDLYFDLCRLASVIMAAVHTKGLPRMFYRHDDLIGCFGIIGESLREAIIQVEAMFLMRPFIRGEHHFQLSQAAIKEGDMLLGLQVSDPVYRNDAIRWFERAHIGSASFIEDIVARRIYGAQRQQVDSYPLFGIKEDSKMALFILTVTPDYFLENETIYISGTILTTGLEDMSILLFTGQKRVPSVLTPQPSGLITA